MRKINFTAKLLLAGILAVSSAAYTQIKEVKHVVVFGVDGMSPNGVKHAKTPNMEFLMKNGAYTMHGRAVLPTVSTPNWEAIISGADLIQTGILSNEWEVNDFTIEPVTTSNENLFPTIFGLIRQQIPKAEIGAIYHWDGFGRLFEKSAPNYDINGSDEFKTTELAVNYIKFKKPTFTFIHLDLVDGAGHGSGHGSPEYYRSIEIADSLLGLVLKASKDAGIYKNTLFIVCADHGGIGFGHGGNSMEELEVPFIMSGPKVKKNYEIKLPYYQYDNAATVAFALGIKPPYAWIGRPVKHAFEGFPVPEIKAEKVYLEQPVIYPEKKFYSPAGGLFVDAVPEVKIQNSEKSGELRYTLDGSEPTINSALYTSPFKMENSGVVSAKVFRGKNEESKTSRAFFRVIKSSQGHGLKYSVYELDFIQFLPVFDNLKPVKTGEVYECRIDKVDHRGENYAVRFEGFIKIEKSGKYNFYTLSDDGSKLYIDGKTIVNNDGDHGTLEKSGSVELTGGRHQIKVEYFNGGGGQWIDVYYKGPGIPKQIVPANALYISK